MTQPSFQPHLRPSHSDDLTELWRIIHTQQQIMHRAGRDQWQNGYPNPETLRQDLDHGYGRVLCIAGQVIGYAALLYDGEPCYDSIFNGTWLTTDTSASCHYAVIHRLAIAPEYLGRGHAFAMINLLCDDARLRCRSLRVDTNHDNVQMLHLLPKAGFTRCGIVYLPDGERIAFERIL